VEQNPDGTVRLTCAKCGVVIVEKVDKEKFYWCAPKVDTHYRENHAKP